MLTWKGASYSTAKNVLSAFLRNKEMLYLQWEIAQVVVCDNLGVHSAVNGFIASLANMEIWKHLVLEVTHICSYKVFL